MVTYVLTISYFGDIIKKYDFIKNGGTKMKAMKKLLLTITLSLIAVLFCTGFGTISANAAQEDPAPVSEAEPLLNRSVINKRIVNAGEVVTVTSVPVGGMEPYHYEYYYRSKTSTEWIYLDRFVDKEVFSRTSSRSGYYLVKSVITDAEGRKAEKSFDLTVVKATGNPLLNAARLNKSVFQLGETVNVSAVVHGGTKPYTFTFSTKEVNGTKRTLASARINEAFSFKPSEPGYYTMTVTAYDRDNRRIQKTLNYTVTSITSSPVENRSNISKNVISAGENLIVNGAASGGTAPYRYSYYYRLRAADRWIPLSINVKSSAFSKKITEPGYYDFLVRVIDYNGVRKDKKLQFAVTKETGEKLINISKLSVNSIEAGSGLVMNAKAEGGKAPYRYRYYAKKNGGQWKRMEGYTPKDTYKYSTSEPGYYTASVMIADANDNVVEKYISFKVIKSTGRPEAINVNASSSLIYSGQSVTINAKADGGVMPYDLSIAYKQHNGVLTGQKSFSSSALYTVRLSDPGEYTFVVTVKFGNGKSLKKEITVDALSSSKLRTIKASTAMRGDGWNTGAVMDIGEGAYATVIKQYGRWFKVYYSGRTMWLYDLAVGNYKNYNEISTSTIDADADDTIFQRGRSMKELYEYVKDLAYSHMDDLGYEENVACMMRFRRGACYQRSSLLCYLLDRAGYEVVRVSDGKTRRGQHNWCIVKTPEGWRHIDPTSVVELSFTYLALDSHMEKGVFWDRNKYPKCV